MKADNNNNYAAIPLRCTEPAIVIASDDEIKLAASRLPYLLDKDSYLMVEHDNGVYYITKIRETNFQFTGGGIRPLFIESISLAPISYWAISNSAQAISNKVSERLYRRKNK